MNVTSSLISLLCITIPISYRNIFGGSYAEFPLPWFYLILILFIFWGIYRVLINYNYQITWFEVLIALLTIVSLVPLLTSIDKIEGIKEYLSYLTYLLGILTAVILKNSYDKEKYLKIIDFYIFGTVFSAIGVIIQYVSYRLFSIVLFRIEFLGGGRNYLSFLFFDMSGMTVYMSTGIIFLFLLKKEKKFLLGSIILIGIALSTARAGLISLILVLILYVLFSKNNKKKLNMILFLLVGSTFGIYILGMTRKNITGILNLFTKNNGRIEPMLDTLNAFIKSPLIGYGYDYGLQLKSVGKVVPHFALLNLLGQTGIIITLLYVFIVLKVLKITKYKKIDDMLWVIILALIGSCVSPGFFDLRFFTVLSVISLTYKEPGLVNSKRR
jgi:uncharacterized membrane protein YqjE